MNELMNFFAPVWEFLEKFTHAVGKATAYLIDAITSQWWYAWAFIILLFACIGLMRSFSWFWNSVGVRIKKVRKLKTGKQYRVMTTSIRGRREHGFILEVVWHKRFLGIGPRRVRQCFVEFDDPAIVKQVDIRVWFEVWEQESRQVTTYRAIEDTRVLRHRSWPNRSEGVVVSPATTSPETQLPKRVVPTPGVIDAHIVDAHIPKNPEGEQP